jgi:hypothetical protein
LTSTNVFRKIQRCPARGSVALVTMQLRPGRRRSACVTKAAPASDANARDWSVFRTSSHRTPQSSKEGRRNRHWQNRQSRRREPLWGRQQKHPQRRLSAPRLHQAASPQAYRAATRVRSVRPALVIATSARSMASRAITATHAAGAIKKVLEQIADTTKMELRNSGGRRQWGKGRLQRAEVVRVLQKAQTLGNHADP